MTPELRQLRYFVAVAEAGSVTRGAATLLVAQQSLSQQIRALESHLGVVVFERSSRGVTLTPAGTVLLRESKSLLAHADRAVDAVRHAAKGQDQVLRVAFLSSVANYLMPPVVRLFRQRYPDVTVHADSVAIAELVSGIREGRFDAGLSRPPLVDDLDTELVLHEPVAAVLPDGHRLAGRSSLALADLADEPWVLTTRTSWPPWHRKYDDDFARAGYRPQVVQRGTTPQGLLALVAAGVGVTRLPMSAQSLRDGGVTFVPLDDDSTSVVLVTRPDVDHPLTSALRSVVRDAAATVPSANGRPA